MTARTWRIALLCALPAIFAQPVGPAAAHAQVIAVKTAPIADGGQFAFLPSANLGIGGLSVTLADSSLDPFINPAKGARLRGTRVFGAPQFFSVSRKAGGGFSLPLGTSLTKGAWFTQLAFAAQDIDVPGDVTVLPPPVVLDAGGATAGAAPVDLTGRLSRDNRYAHALLGRRIGSGLAVAGSASWWTLNALDGVELYFPGAQRVRQHGDALDLRLGATRALRGGQALEALALYNRFDVAQDVALTEVFWDPSLRQMVPMARIDPNADTRETWGLHVAYTRPLADSTWRVGAIATANVIRQPSVPGYTLPQVPADASRSQAFNLGGGVTRATRHWLVGVDAIVEPIASRSWVRADRPTEAGDGTTIDAGANTLESRFRFTNGIARAGVAATVPLADARSLTFETGGQVHAIRYRLTQWDAIRRTSSASTQHWNEWTRSWGIALGLGHGTLRYAGNVTTGAGRPGFDGGGLIFVAEDVRRPSAISSVRPPPFGPWGGPTPLPFGKVRATTHQISFSIPIQ